MANQFHYSVYAKYDYIDIDTVQLIWQGLKYKTFAFSESVYLRGSDRIETL